jgi:hypothetical protein
MGADKRKSRRQPLDRRAWLHAEENGALIVECTIINMSETGAKLVLKGAADLPEQFILRLSADGRVARKCRIAWESGSEMGVQFVARLVREPGTGRQEVEPVDA